MTAIPETIAIAVQRHQAGQLAEAERLYRKILAAEPNHIDALHLLGVVVHQIDRRVEAIDFIQRAIALNDNQASFHNSLGNTLKAHGRLDEAAASYRRAIELKPDYAEAHNHLGNTYRALDRLEESVAAHQRALELNPKYADAYNNLGNVLADQEKHEEAAVAYRRGLELKPTFSEAFNNLGTTLKRLGRMDEAVAAIRRALELNPRFSNAEYNLGNAYFDQGKIDEAVDCYRRALELEPTLSKANYNRACAWLLAGNWGAGWPEYEYRWQQPNVTPRLFPQPSWDGSDLTGKTILLHAEQGLGDTIQFIRFAPILKQRGAKVIVESQEPLMPLLAQCGTGFDQLVARDRPLPAFDVHVPFMSVPRILNLTIDTIPNEVPYLVPPRPLVEKWRERLKALDGFKIGINWQGNPKYRFDQYRSISLRHFAALARVPGVHLISLQKGAGSEQLKEIQNDFHVTDLGPELDLTSGPFMDTATVMTNLDLIITSDTAVAHLAGALGVPVWVGLQFVPDWRWLLDRADSPWYPTMRLFRQPEPRNWGRVFAEMADALRPLPLNVRAPLSPGGRGAGGEGERACQ